MRDVFFGYSLQHTSQGEAWQELKTFLYSTL
jgi:hypothetical protein